MTETAELVDNDFLRQFELKVENELAIIEYSLQERKIFLTKMIIPDTIRTDEFELDFIDLVFTNIKERNTDLNVSGFLISKFNTRYCFVYTNFKSLVSKTSEKSSL